MTLFSAKTPPYRGLIVSALVISALLFASLPVNAEQHPLSNTHPNHNLHYQYHIVQSIPHDNLFTQGLVVDDHYLWESSGLFGKSFIQIRQKDNQKTLLNQPISKHHFAEGITIYGDHLYGLTWRSGVVYRWHKHTLKEDTRYRLEGEGWGITTWNNKLAVSNGTNNIQFRNPDNFLLERSIHVSLHNNSVNNINDLTANSEAIWANIWHKNHLIRIDPHSGAINGLLNLNELAKENRQRIPKHQRAEAVLNGIAWDSSSNTLWVTGKLWPKLYQLKISSPITTIGHAIKK